MARRNKRTRALSPVAAARRRRRRAWTVAALSVAAFVIVSAAVTRHGGVAGHHPTPRPVAQHPQVVSAVR